MPGKAEADHKPPTSLWPTKPSCQKPANVPLNGPVYCHWAMLGSPLFADWPVPPKVMSRLENSPLSPPVGKRQFLGQMECGALSPLVPSPGRDVVVSPAVAAGKLYR